MHKRLLLLVALLAALPAFAAQTVSLKWVDPVTQAWATCSSTVTLTCADHLTVFDTTSASPGTIVSDGIALAATAVSFASPTPNFVAQRTYTLSVAYKDMNGTLQYTSGATCGNTNTAPPCVVTGFTVTPPNIPTNFTGSVQ